MGSEVMMKFLLCAFLFLALEAKLMAQVEDPATPANVDVHPKVCLQKTTSGAIAKYNCYEFDASINADVNAVCVYHNNLWMYGAWRWKKVGTARFIPSFTCDEGIEYSTTIKESQIAGPRYYNTSEVTVVGSTRTSTVAALPVGTVPTNCYLYNNPVRGISSNDKACNVNYQEPGNDKKLVCKQRDLTLERNGTGMLYGKAAVLKGLWFVMYNGVYDEREDSSDPATAALGRAQNKKSMAICLGGSRTGTLEELGLPPMLKFFKLAHQPDGTYKVPGDSREFDFENDSSITVKSCYYNTAPTKVNDYYACDQSKCSNTAASAGCCRYIGGPWKAGVPPRPMKWYRQSVNLVKERLLLPDNFNATGVAINLNLDELAAPDHMRTFRMAPYVYNASSNAHKYLDNVNQFRHCHSIGVMAPLNPPLPLTP
jgi:hypothetical protein